MRGGWGLSVLYNEGYATVEPEVAVTGQVRPLRMNNFVDRLSLYVPSIN
jgi:hypothetical protein